MLIVEGPDGAGKTTLIRHLQQELAFDIAPRVVSKDAEAMVDLPAWVDENLRRGFQHLIFDRHRLISEPIYGPILRTHQEQGFDDFGTMISWMFRFYAIEPIIVYCLPPLSEVLRNITHDPDNVVVSGHIEAIYSAYVARAAIDCRLNKHTFVYNYLNGDPHALATVLKGIVPNAQ